MMKRLLSVLCVMICVLVAAPAAMAKKSVSTADSINAVVAREAIESRQFLFQATHMVYAGRDYQVLPATSYFMVDGDQAVVQWSVNGAPQVPGSYTQEGTITKWKERVKKNGDREITIKIKTLARLVDVTMLIYADCNEGVVMVPVHSQMYLQGTLGRLDTKRVVEGFRRH